MSEEETEIDSNPFALALKFIMNYNEEAKEVEPNTHENLKEMLVSYLTQQQEYNDLKAEKEFYDEQLEVLMKDNKNYLDEDDVEKIDGDVEDKVLALKRMLHEMTEKTGHDGLLNGRSRGNSFNANLADKVEDLEKQIVNLGEELEQKQAEMAELAEEKIELDNMIKEMDFKIEEVNNELRNKSKMFERERREFETKDKKYQEEMMELRTDCDHYRGLYDNYVKSVKDFKTDNSEKFKTLMQEQELLKREINDYKIREKEAENKIGLLKADLTKKGKLLTNVETREFILKQQLETIQEEIEEEKSHLINENEDLQSRVHEYENKVEDLKSELESVMQRRKSTIEENKNMNSLLTELHGFEEEEEESAEKDFGRKKSLKRRKTGKEEMLDNLTKLMNSKTKSGKKKPVPSSASKKEVDQLNKKIKTLEKRIESMAKLTSSLQRKLKEEKQKTTIGKKHLARKDTEIERLRQKLLDTTMSYSDIMNDLNEQLDTCYEVNRRLKRKLKHKFYSHFDR